MVSSKWPGAGLRVLLADEAAHTQRMIEAIYTAAASGQPVEVA